MLSSCTTGGGSGPGGSDDRTFDIAIGVDLDTVDPVQQTTTTVQNVVDYGVETLTKLDKTGSVQPSLAESWETSNGGKTITFKLREGVKFHDGTDFDAEAAKFNLDRLLDPNVNVPIRANYEVIDKVTAVDAMTLRLDLKNPDPNLPSDLATTIGGMISPDSVDKLGNSYKNIVEPVGTGPYTFERFAQGDQAVYKKFGDYWGKKPYYNEVVFHIVPEDTSREAMLRAGQADMIMNPPVSDLEALEKDDSTAVLKAPSDRSVFVAFNTSKPPFDDAKVRQALNYAVDKKTIAREVLFGSVDAMDAPLASSVDGYCRSGYYEFDPEKARQLLDEAGVKNLSITFGTPTGRYLQDKEAAQAIAAYLSDVGVKAKVRTMDWPSYQAATAEPANQQTFDMHLLGWAPGALDAPTQFQMFQTAQHPPTGLATSFYSNAKVDSLVAKANVELDDQRRNAMYCEAQQQIWQDAPWMFLWSQTLVLAYSEDVAGVSYIPNEKFNTVYAHPAE
ncbi:MAG: ABC transporter substrate-binding protein [Nocardioidaceae bacterium]